MTGNYPVPGAWLRLQAPVIDVVGEVEHDALGLHAERGGDELGTLHA
jgi:hypothetical protein